MDKLNQDVVYKEVAFKTIGEILEGNLIPMLITTAGTFDVSPKAVKSLKIDDFGISFVCTYDGSPQKEASLWDDVIAIEAAEDL